MRNGSTSLAKVALVRDESYPQGVPAPLFLRCHCGGRPSVNPGQQIVTCYGCGTKYTGSGWLLNPKEAPI